MSQAGALADSRSDLLSSSRRRCPPLSWLCASSGVTTVSRKLQLDEEARSEASSTPRMMSACSSLWRALRTPSCSTAPTPSRSPAVSLSKTGNPAKSTGVSSTSRVVPGSGDTMDTGFWLSRFTRLLLPALGGPVTTTFAPERSLCPRLASRRWEPSATSRARTSLSAW